jgi:hypothetical protein
MTNQGGSLAAALIESATPQPYRAATASGSLSMPVRIR